MEDIIIKGTGNSRYLKGPANIKTLFPTWEDALEALMNGSFPVDISGTNPAGVEVEGTPLNKSTLLTDDLCTALDIDPATSTPTEAMEKLRTMASNAQSTANAKIRCAVGYYAGNGAESRVISLPFTPIAVFVLYDGSYLIQSSATFGGLAVTGSDATFYGESALSVTTGGFIVHYKVIKYSQSYHNLETNASGVNYNYIAFG